MRKTLIVGVLLVGVGVGPALAEGTEESPTTTARAGATSATVAPGTGSPAPTGAATSGGTPPTNLVTAPRLTLSPDGSGAGSPAAGTPTTAYDLGKAAFAAQDWPTAITQFELAAKTERKNADIYNFLGFSYRSNGDYPTAMKHYSTALKLNPKHRGALEYQGEAYLKLGQLSKAKANLTRLGKICAKKCEEYKDLAADIAAYTP